MPAKKTTQEERDKKKSIKQTSDRSKENFKNNGINSCKPEYTLENSLKLFNDLLELSKEDDAIFIGTLCKRLDTNRNQIFYLVNEKYPNELKPIYMQVKSNIESNCFEQSARKDGKINTTMAILSLKAFYPEWNTTEKTENINKNENVVWVETKTYKKD